MPAIYPAAVAAFTTKNDGDVVAAAHINAVQDEIAAIEASLIGGALPNPQKIVATAPASAMILDPARPHSRGAGVGRTHVSIRREPLRLGPVTGDDAAQAAYVAAGAGSSPAMAFCRQRA
jgi:hypothetical protein